VILFIAAFLLAEIHASAAPAPTVNPALEPCVEADALLDVQLGSANNVAGDGFRFKLSRRVPKTVSQAEIPAGTIGYGIVSYAQHAGSGGQAGTMILEPRYLALRDGTHVQVMADPAGPDLVRSGRNKNAPGLLEAVPMIGLAAGGYNALHRGKDIVLEKGMPLRIIIGDGLATSSCYVALPGIK
jgi:hypothetical protein